jgi:hypothetical protein
LTPKVSSGGGMPGVEIVPIDVADSPRLLARSTIGLHRKPTGQNEKQFYNQQESEAHRILLLSISALANLKYLI